MRRFGLLILFVVLVAGCGSGGSEDSGPTGRVSGHAVAGPTCPVQQPDEPPCEPAPVEGVVEFVQGGSVVASADLDEEGFYIADLSPGIYTLSVDVGDTPFPRCEPVDVDVVAEAAVIADISCDTGIR